MLNQNRRALPARDSKDFTLVPLGAKEFSRAFLGNLVTTTATWFIGVDAPHQDAIAAAHHALRAASRIPADHADGMGLGYVFRDRQEVRPSLARR